MSYVMDIEGVRAEIDSVNGSEMRLRLNDGQIIVVPRSILTVQEDGSYRLSQSLRSLINAESIVLPLVAEEIEVEKREVEGATVRITKRVHDEQVTVDEALRSETTIIPIMEEVLVVEKRLVLREELHVTRRQTEKHEPQTHTLRREEVTVERVNRNV
jgi:stress response protein YsnF